VIGSKLVAPALLGVAEAGKVRHVEVVGIYGDVPVALLSTEIFRLSQFHPASSFIPSRLPMPLHYADRMIKEVQRLGQVGVLHNVDRQKIFAA
jgi:argonaute-like protein implicated in RNA metabolism and viral defense